MVNETLQTQAKAAFYTNVKTNNSNSGDEFQALLNDTQKEQKDEKSKLRNIDLDISKAKADFESYAQAKVYRDGLKKAEENQLNKLFELIDKNTQNR